MTNSRNKSTESCRSFKDVTPNKFQVLIKWRCTVLMSKLCLKGGVQASDFTFTSNIMKCVNWLKFIKRWADKIIW
jgi:hypothetical protein